MKIERLENRLTLKDFQNVIPKEKKEEIEKFLEKNIIKNVLMAITGNILQDRRYDLIYSKKTIEICEKYLKKEEKFFTEENKKILEKYENICVEVDEDNDSYVYANQKIEEDNIKNITIVPTYITYEEFSEKIEKEVGLKEWKEKINIYKIIESFYSENKYGGDIQIGGYVIWPIQSDYENFIGYYNGGYGDAGAVYLYINKENISSSVDMY